MNASAIRDRMGATEFSILQASAIWASFKTSRATISQELDEQLMQ